MPSFAKEVRQLLSAMSKLFLQDWSTESAFFVSSGRRKWAIILYVIMLISLVYVLLVPAMFELPDEIDQQITIPLLIFIGAWSCYEFIIKKELFAKIEMEREMEVAQTIQGKLFPQSLPCNDTISFAGFHKPAKAVGGDYYDVIPLGNGRFGIVIADVSGKGISAAILMAGVRAQIRFLVEANLSPQEIVQRVNAALVSETNPAQFITLFYGALDTTILRIEYVNAGHNPPFAVGADGKITTLETGGIPVGSFPDATFDTGVVNLSPGDRVILYTDGVTEAGDPATSDFDDDALRKLVIDNRTQDEKQIVELIMKKVDSLNSKSEQSDDVTLLVFRTLP